MLPGSVLVFGGLKTNYPLEQTFSTFGAHVEDEHDALPKEATVNHTIALRDER